MLACTRFSLLDRAFAYGSRLVIWSLDIIVLYTKACMPDDA